MRSKRFSVGWRVGLAVLVIILLAANAFPAELEVLYGFKLTGGDPVANVIIDSAGSLYGTTAEGGTYGGGTVFRLLAPQSGGPWVLHTLHSFPIRGTVDGINPFAGMIFGTDSNTLYGTTFGGGTHGAGTVFQMTRLPSGEWDEVVLHDFKDKDGANPFGGLVSDSAGNLYGTTRAGGVGFGTVFEMSPAGDGTWTEKVLHKFKNDGEDGIAPYATLAFDGNGNLYGTTLGGGSAGVGTVFELVPIANGKWTEKILHKFKNDGKDGMNPYASVVLDASGDVYGTTFSGGAPGFGMVFELIPKSDGSWTETILHTFKSDGRDGVNPYAGVVFDSSGNLYGTTYGGGTLGLGMMFELSFKLGEGWTEERLVSFDNSPKGGPNPSADLVVDAQGNIYGTTPTGGHNNQGTVFEVTH
jgi:uncharacterized repeat protein (TIGR03803 family)